ncbi:MAG: carbohydrate binding domain-containing protein [Gammaproteobacteria bacterium]|nr:carbohydrate binding domain-containing protein [Gammaproteobacteria bacterium]
MLAGVFFILYGCATTPSETVVSQPAAAVQPGDRITGVYRLVAVNGVRVPGTLVHDGARLEIESGIFKIGADGKITSQTVFTPPEGDQATRRVKATYTRDGSSLLMRWEGAGMTRGSIDGEVFVMNNHGMILVYTRSGEIDPSMDLALLGRCEPNPETIVPPAGVFDGFDHALFDGLDCHGNMLGYFTFRDSARTQVEISTTSDHPPRPGEAQNNRVLQMDLKVKDWAGVIHNFENAAVDTWTPRDWNAFKAFSFWIYGSNSGTALFVDILDNRGPGSTYDDAERFTYSFVDDFSGWKKITVPFREMVRKPIGNLAPADGFNLHEVNGWGLGATRTRGSLTLYLDDFELIEYAPGESRRSQEQAPGAYPINELPMYGYRHKTPAQKQADEVYIESMMRRFDSRAEAARSAAELGWKFYYDGDSRTAIKRFNQAWLLDPNDQYALWGFAVISADRDQLQKSIRYFRMAIDSGPSNPELQRDYEKTLQRIEQ